MSRLHGLCAVALWLMLFSNVATGQTWDNYRSLLRDKTVKVEQTNLPIVFLETGGQMIMRFDYIAARMKVLHNGDGSVNYGDTTAHTGQHIDFEGNVAIKYRGNTSFSLADKKPFTFRTLRSEQLPAEGGKKQKTEILGMPKDDKWCLIAPWCDQTMLRDILTFELARSWMDWVPRGRLCELFLDGTYRGVYLLAETVSKGRHRLDLDDPATDADGNVIGDWHISADHAYYDSYYTSPNAPWLTLDGSSRGVGKPVKYQYRHPDFSELDDVWEEDEVQRLWQELQPLLQAVNADIDRMEEAFLADDWQDPVRGYASQIDPLSFADYMLATELAMNIDGYRLSTHLYRHDQRRAAEGMDTRWHLTLWDFNIGWGNANYYGGHLTDQWQYELNVNYGQWDDSLVPFYWYRLLQDESFKQLLCERWTAYRESTHSDERLFATIDSLANVITTSGADERNERAWGVFKRTKIWPLPYYAKSYDDAVAYLKDWTRRRLQFLDGQLLLPSDGIAEVLPESGEDKGRWRPQGQGASLLWDLAGRRIGRGAASRHRVLIFRGSDGRMHKGGGL